MPHSLPEESGYSLPRIAIDIIITPMKKERQEKPRGRYAVPEIQEFVLAKTECLCMSSNAAVRDYENDDFTSYFGS